MTLDQITQYGINPALAYLTILGADFMDTKPARHELLAIALQESELKYRRQQFNGPAMGFWQFERGGAVTGVMNHPATKGYAEALCRHSQVAFTRADIWKALEHDDVLAAGFARLNLWWSPLALPEEHNEAAGWDLYFTTWRPGRPRKETWESNFEQARQYVYEVAL